MIYTNLINEFIKIFTIDLCAFLFCFKIIDFKSNKLNKIIILFNLILISLIYSIIKLNSQTLLAIICLCVLLSMLLALTIKKPLYYTIFIIAISLAISFIIGILSTIIVAAITYIINPNIEVGNIFILLIICLVQFISIYSLTKLKRLKYGISFLKEEKNKKNINLIELTFFIIVILIYCALSFFKTKEDNIFLIVIISGIIIVGISTIKWIQDSIEFNFKIKMQQKTIIEQENIIKDKEMEIERLNKNLLNSSKIIHSFKHRISALSNIVKNKIDTELSDELSISMGEIKKLSNDLQNAVNKSKDYKIRLPLTNVFGIDSMLNYMFEKCKNNNIEFNLKINGSINYMSEKIIEQNDLETLIGDLLENSIIAINSNNKSYRAILSIIGILNNCYSICIYDSGIEFEEDTLIKLGIEPVTTHPNEGGSGIGFITIFEIMNKYNASLIIEERSAENIGYTKSITICFNGLNNYILRTYRASTLKSKNINNRIIIQNI